MIKLLSKLRGTAVFLSLVAALTFVSVAPALAYGNVHTVRYAIKTISPTSTVVDQIRARAWGWNSGWNPVSPNDWPGHPHMSSYWGMFQSSTPFGFTRRVIFGVNGGPTISPGTPGWFTLNFIIPGGGPPRHTWARFKWFLLGAPVSGPIPIGSKWASPPQLYNSAVDETESGESTPNIDNMVVTNLRFANSPAPVGGDELTLDNPEVQGLFASSPDSTRSGPIVVAPGEESSISPPMDAGILDPVSGGRTVLMAGEVEDSSGTPTPFVVEYIADEPTPTPSSSAWSIFALLIVAIAMIFSGRRFKARLERTGKISP